MLVQFDACRGGRKIPNSSQEKVKARNVSGRGERGPLCDSGSKILLGREGEIITAMVIDKMVIRNVASATNSRVEVLLFLPT